MSLRHSLLQLQPLTPDEPHPAPTTNNPAFTQTLFFLFDIRINLLVTNTASHFLHTPFDGPWHTPIDTLTFCLPANGHAQRSNSPHTTQKAPKRLQHSVVNTVINTFITANTHLYVSLKVSPSLVMVA
jgi:hypothetical protein